MLAKSLFSLGRLLSKSVIVTFPRQLSVSSPRHDLMDFFEPKKNWGETVIRVGRSWKADELRLKSNADLHKLWYILLKEKNMLLTMEAAAKDAAELHPNPERIDKVEESMAALEEVVRERNRAYYTLETGTTGERPGTEEENWLGLPEYRQFEEYPQPPEENKEWLKEKEETLETPADDKIWFLRLLAEKQRKMRRYEAKQSRKYVRQIIHKFPHVDRELLKERYPDVYVERVIEETDEIHLGNERPKHYYWNRNVKKSVP